MRINPSTADLVIDAANATKIKWIIDQLYREINMLKCGESESAAKKHIEVAGELGGLIGWEGEGYSRPTWTCVKLIKTDEPGSLERGAA